MDIEKPEYCYIARKPCGCVCAATVDIPEMQKDNAREIAKWIRWGCTIERMTVEAARPLLTFDCNHDKPKKKKVEQLSFL